MNTPRRKTVWKVPCVARFAYPQRSGTAPSKYMRQAYFFVETAERRRMRGLASLASMMRWLGRLPFVALSIVRVRGRAIAKLHGKSIIRQFAEVLWIATTTPCEPIHYYRYRCYEKQRGKRIGDFIFRFHTKGTIYRLLGGLRLRDISPLGDKVQFFSHCTANDLPVVRTLAVVTASGEWAPERAHISEDLFIKPVKGRGGRDAMLWRQEHDQRYRNQSSGEVMDLHALRHHLCDTVQRGGWIVQERIRNHPRIRALSGDTVATVRIVSIINESGEPEIVGAVFRMPGTNESVVDNLHRGGLASGVDLCTGTIGFASQLDGGVRMSHHPVSEMEIDGFELPQWKQVMDLAVKAHFAFRPRIIVGWDIAISEDGPVLIEGNSEPCVDLMQVAADKPLGPTRFGELLSIHLETALNNRYRNGGAEVAQRPIE